jgi:endo-1,4-beta-xylanase
MRKITFRLIAVILVTLFCLQFAAAAPSGQRLRTLADQLGFLIGFASQNGFMSTDGGTYARVGDEEFNFLTAENCMKMDALQPSQNNFNFGEADQHVQWALNNGMQVHGHTLVWHNQSPGWIQGIGDRNSLISAMNNHIDKVLNHFRGKVLVWDVVNEAFNDDGTYRRSFWYNVIGQSYIDLAFQRARQADSDVKLIYNDYNLAELRAKSDATYNMVKSMIQRGIPIDGVGFQMHLTQDGINYQSFADNMARFADLGLEIYITEMDVRMPDSNRDLQKQATIYREVLERCLAEPACKALQVWGITDKYSWCMSTFPGTGVPLIFNDSYSAKPAYYALQDVLDNYTPLPTPTPTPTGMKGDTNGDNSITIIDALMIAQHYIGNSPAGFIASNADTNCDGVITILDALIVAQLYVGLISSFPC